MEAQPSPVAADATDVFGGRRVSIEPDSLFLEARDNIMGVFQPLDEIFWEEVEEVYVWRSPDWGGVGVGAFLAFFAAFGVRVALIFAPNAWFADLLALLIFLSLLAAGIYTSVRHSPRRSVRVVGAGREIRFHTSQSKLVGALLHCLGRDAEGF